MDPMTRLVQSVDSMAMAADDSLLRTGPSEGAVLCLHKAHPEPFWCVGYEAPEIGCLIGLIHVSNASQV